MDKVYLIKHLLEYAKLFYGKKNKKYCFSDKKDNMYIFGYDNGKIRVENKVSKEVAIYICINQIRVVSMGAKIRRKRKR